MITEKQFDGMHSVLRVYLSERMICDLKKSAQELGYIEKPISLIEQAREIKSRFYDSFGNCRLADESIILRAFNLYEAAYKEATNDKT